MITTRVLQVNDFYMIFILLIIKFDILKFEKYHRYNILN